MDEPQAIPPPAQQGAPVTHGPVAAGPVAAAFFAPGQLATRLRPDDADSWRGVSGRALFCLAILLVVPVLVAGLLSASPVFAAVWLLVMCGGVFAYPFLRLLAWRTLTLRRFAVIYAHVLPIAVAQMLLFYLAALLAMSVPGSGLAFVVSFFMGLWQAVALAILLRRTLAFPYWKFLIGITLGAVVQLAAFTFFLLTHLPHL